MADTLRDIGAQMANVMFNLAQRPGDALTGDHVATMDGLRKQWDAAVRATPPSPSTAPEVDVRHEFELYKSNLGEAANYIGDGLYGNHGVTDQANAFRAGIEVGRRAALASRPAEVDDKIPRESNDALIDLAKYWKLDGDWMTCKGCRRSLIASRDGEELNHGDGCKFWDQQHPWAQLRDLIARRPAPAESGA